jgi:adenosylcobinamide kinase/adenosylcobinamide-phosphate guanylyltransferase
VSPEVGWGVVPATRSGRLFADTHGRLNQRVAAACDAVVLVVAGLALPLKRDGEPLYPDEPLYPAG